MTCLSIIFSLMFSLRPVDSLDKQLTYTMIAHEICRTDASSFETALLVAIGNYESGFVPTARGKLGELGVWQIMPSNGSPTAETALRLIRTSYQLCGSLAGYAGGFNCKLGKSAAFTRQALAYKLFQRIKTIKERRGQ